MLVPIRTVRRCGCVEELKLRLVIHVIQARKYARQSNTINQSRSASAQEAFQPGNITVLKIEPCHRRLETQIWKWHGNMKREQSCPNNIPPNQSREVRFVADFAVSSLAPTLSFIPSFFPRKVGMDTLDEPTLAAALASTVEDGKKLEGLWNKHMSAAISASPELATMPGMKKLARYVMQT